MAKNIQDLDEEQYKEHTRQQLVKAREASAAPSPARRLLDLFLTLTLTGAVLFLILVHLGATS